MKFDNITNQIYIVAYNEAKLQGHEFVTPEHILYSILLFDIGKNILQNSGANIENIISDLNTFFEENLYKYENAEPIESFELLNLFNLAYERSKNAGKDTISIDKILISLFDLKDSFAFYILQKNGFEKLPFLTYISDNSDNLNYDNYNNTVKSTSPDAISEKEVEFLEKYTTEFVEKAKADKFDPLIGRKDVLDRTIQVLSRRLKNNPIHVGSPGVGKTAIVEGLAQLIANGKVPASLKNSKIYYIDMAALLAGTKYRGDFEERFITLLDIISKEYNPIIYIDEIHTIVGAGAVSGGAMDATNILKPYLLKSNLKIIGSTTHEEYQKYFEKERALARRFQRIEINEPSINDCIKILNGIKGKYESYHNVVYTPDAIVSASELSAKYMTDKKLPDKAIDLIDEAGAYIKLTKRNTKKATEVNSDIIKKIISSTTKIPLERLTENDITRLKNLEKNLKSVIFGQDNAISSIVNVVKASRSGLNDTERPIASLLFVGSTGVGKTELAKQLAVNMSIPLKRFDMSEYQEKHSVSKLIGAPPGYVGYEKRGLLTDTVEKNPHCVLLLDEIEKAHQDIFNILLQVMDYGELTDSTGKHIDFRNVILLMTSNAGANQINKNIIGFDNKILGNTAIENEIEKTFSPEFRNRLDNIIIFNRINKEIAVYIAKKAIGNLAKRLKNKAINLKLSDDVYEYIVKKGFSEEFGAREINRIVESEIKNKLIDEILFGKLSNGGSVILSIKNSELKISYRKKTNSKI